MSTAAASNKKIGRNSPCPCGSGKKHKKCCGARDEKKKPRAQQDLLAKTYTLYERGLFVEASSLCNKVLKREPEHVGAIRLMCLIKLGQRDFVETQKFLLIAEYLDPADPDIKFNLGSLFLAQGKWQQSLEAFRQAEKLSPTDPSVLTSIGFVLHNLGDTNDGINYCRRAIQIAEDFIGGYVNLGIILEDAGQDDELYVLYEKLLRLDPNVPAPYVWLLRKYNEGKEHRKSESLINNILANPKELARPGLVAELGKECDWLHKGKIQELLVEKIRHRQLSINLLESALFVLNYAENLSPGEFSDFHRQWGEAVESGAKVDKKTYRHIDKKTFKIRIAYLSADFRDHPVGFFIRNIIARHDTDNFEIFCYYNSTVVDEVTDFIAANTSSFNHVNELSDLELADKIFKDKVDILIDLSGHTVGSRLAVLARRPAPVQMTYLGYPNTTGLETVDYRISDPYCDIKNGTEYTEELLTLPESFLCFGALDEVEIFEEIPAVRNKRITFGSFNNIQKINPEVISVWAQIMLRLESAQLFIKADDVELTIVQNNIKKEFVMHGVDESRLIFQGRTTSHKDHLSLYNEVDIALDPFPYNGTTTTCEALWMGVPVITLVGVVHAQRVAYSILRNTGLEEMATFEKNDYVNTAVEMACDVGRLKKLRGSLRETLRDSILCDPQRFTRQLEDAYREVWAIHQ